MAKAAAHIIYKQHFNGFFLVSLGILVGTALGYLLFALPPTDKNCSSCSGSCIAQEQQAPAEGVCDNWLPATDLGESDPWKWMKWIGRPSKCKVAGLLIEELEPENNFRRGLALGFADLHDLTNMLPYMRAVLDPSMAASGRRVLVDLGGKIFNSSLIWFLRMYPLDFTEVYIFEARPGLFQLPIPPSADEEQNMLIEVEGRPYRRLNGPGPIPSWMLQRIRSYNYFVTNHDSASSPQKNVTSVNITRFLTEELRLSASDAVVVKMDIEDSEWNVLEDWMIGGQMAAIVDELFLELHYHHPSMERFRWGGFKHTREEATELFQRLRRSGFYVHPWP